MEDEGEDRIFLFEVKRTNEEDEDVTFREGFSVGENLVGEGISTERYPPTVRFALYLRPRSFQN